jgi:hypothetical protein
MLYGVRRWAQELESGWRDGILWEGSLVQGGDPPLRYREGLGALAAGENGLAWVVVGALGGLFSRLSGKAAWNEVTDFTASRDPMRVTFGYERNEAKGRVTFAPRGDSLEAIPPGKTLRSRYRWVANQHLARKGWLPYEELDSDVEASWSIYRMRPPASAGSDLAEFLRLNAPELVERMKPDDLLTPTAISYVIARIGDETGTGWGWWQVFVSRKEDQDPHQWARVAGEGGALKDTSTLRQVANAHLEYGEESRQLEMQRALERGGGPPVPPWAPPDDLVPRMVEEMSRARASCTDQACACHLTEEAEQRPRVAQSLAEGHGLPSVVHFLECGHVIAMPPATENAISLFCSECHSSKMVRHEFRVVDAGTPPRCRRHRDE